MEDNLKIESNPQEFQIVKIEKAQSIPKVSDQMLKQFEVIMKAFKFGRLGMIIFSLIICLQLPGNISLKSKIAVVLLKIIQYIFIRVFGVKIKSSKKALELLETFYYRVQAIYDINISNIKTSNSKEVVTQNEFVQKKLLL